MCIASKQIKLCTCAGDSYEDLPHYWVLYRFNENKDLMILGEAIFPEFQPDYAINLQSLLQRLNESDVFDKKMEFIENDCLEICLNNLKDFGEQMLFCFKYRESRWMEDEFDAFIENHYDEIDSGEVEI